MAPYDAASHAIGYGILAAAAFSGAVGIYRRGFIAGVVMGLCTGAIMIAATNPLSILPIKSSRPSGDWVTDAGTTQTVDRYDATLQATAYGAMAGAMFSGVVGFWRRGLVHGIFLGLCTGAIMLAATIPYWLTLLGVMPALR